MLRAGDAAAAPLYAGAWHFRDEADAVEEYEYDENGNMTKDLNSNISLVEYNSLNLPSVITFSNNMDNITNIYTSTGTKLRSISSKYAYLLEDPLVDLYAPTDNQAAEPMLSVDEHPDFVVVDNDAAVAYVQEEDNALAEAVDDSNDEAVISEEVVNAPSKCKRFWGNIGLEESKITDYCGNVIYQDGKRMLLVDGGYVTFNDSLSYGEGLGGACYHYYLKDHLGNVRVVFNDQDSIEQVNDYYAFGGIMATSWGGDSQRYKYNGKELETLHGLDWYDYGARWMSPVIGRFTTPDPKQWDTPQVSSFAYCENNPIKYIDPDGRVKVLGILPENQNNQLLIQNAINYPDDGTAIHIFAHGNTDHIEVYGTYGTGPLIFNDVNDVLEQADQMSLKNFTVYDTNLGDDFVDFVNQSLNSEDMHIGTETDATIVLHSCNTGQKRKDGEDSFASALSKALPNATIIAPSGKIAVDGKVGGKTEEFVKGGDWKQFENGIEKARYNGSRYPCADTLFGIHP